jgi:hypothetical protein
VKRNPLTFRPRCWLWTKGCVWFIGWGAPVGAVGIALCIPIITVPIGLFFLFIAAWPLAHMLRRRGEKVRMWKESPVPGLTEKDLPWTTLVVDEPWNER